MAGLPIPRETLRLFHDHGPGELLAPGHRAFLIGRLLEDGDTADLAWLVELCGEGELRHWLEERGGRQLSRRSRAFWRLLLDEEAPAAEVPDGVPDEGLWPL